MERVGGADRILVKRMEDAVEALLDHGLERASEHLGASLRRLARELPEKSLTSIAKAIEQWLPVGLLGLALERRGPAAWERLGVRQDDVEKLASLGRWLAGSGIELILLRGHVIRPTASYFRRLLKRIPVDKPPIGDSWMTEEDVAEMLESGAWLRTYKNEVYTWVDEVSGHHIIGEDRDAVILIDYDAWEGPRIHIYPSSPTNVDVIETSNGPEILAHLGEDEDEWFIELPLFGDYRVKGNTISVTTMGLDGPKISALSGDVHIIANVLHNASKSDVPSPSTLVFNTIGSYGVELPISVYRIWKDGRVEKGIVLLGKNGVEARFLETPPYTLLDREKVQTILGDRELIRENAGSWQREDFVETAKRLATQGVIKALEGWEKLGGVYDVPSGERLKEIIQENGTAGCRKTVERDWVIIICRGGGVV